MNIKILTGTEAKELKIAMCKRDQSKYRKLIEQEKQSLIGLGLYASERADIYHRVRKYTNMLRQATRQLNELTKEN